VVSRKQRCTAKQCRKQGQQRLERLHEEKANEFYVIGAAKQKNRLHARCGLITCQILIPDSLFNKQLEVAVDGTRHGTIA